MAFRGKANVGYIEVRPALRSIDVFFEDGEFIGDLRLSEMFDSLESAYKMLRGHILLKIRGMRDNVEMYQSMEERLQGYLSDLSRIENPDGTDFWCIVRGDGQVP